MSIMAEKDDILSSRVIPKHWFIEEKIESAFLDVCWSKINDGGFIQFWAPVKIRGRQLLSTFNQPFESAQTGSLTLKYRLFCVRYAYTIYDCDTEEIKGEEDPVIIIGGPVSTAFLNQVPEVVLDLRRMDHAKNPLVPYALECDFTSSFILPVFYPYEKTTRCVGVVECFMTMGSDPALFFNQLINALRRVGLTTLHVQECQTYKTIPSLKCARDEIEDALEIVCESHNLTLAQVWIPYEIDNHDHVSSLGDTKTKQMFAVKLVGYLFSSITQYLDMFPSRIGQGLAGKTLQTYKTYFCKDISELNDNGLLPLFLPSNSCLTICLRSIHTGDLDYGFEFLWPRVRNYRILLPSLLSTLNRCLPSFTFASGAKLGDELGFIDINNSKGSIIRCSNNFHGNELSPLHKTYKKRKGSVVDESISSLEVQRKTTPIPLPRKDIKQQFGTTRKKPSKNYYGWQGRNFPKRKFSDSCIQTTDSTETDSCTSNSDSAESPYRETVMFKVEYGDDVIAFHLPISSLTILAVKKQIDECFEVNGSYRIVHLDDNEWYIMDDDDDLRICLMLRKVNRTHIRLKVLPKSSTL